MQKYRNQILIGIGFSLLVIIGIIAFANVRDLINEIQSFTYWLFIPMLVLKLINWAFRYGEWHYFLNVIDVNISSEPTAHATDETEANLNIFDSIILWTAGLPIAISPGKLAEVLKSFVLRHISGIAVSRSMPVVFAERLVDGMAVLVLASVSGLVFSDVIFGPDVESTYAQAVLVGTVFLFSFIVLVVQFRPVMHWLLDLWKHLPYVGRYHNGLREFYGASYEILKLKHILLTMGMGLIGYIADGIIFYLILIGVGESHSLELMGVSFFILGFSVIIAALSAMPGGAGGRELTVGALLSAIVGMSDATIGLVVLLVGFAQIWFGTMIGLVVIFIFRDRLFPPAFTEAIETYEAQAQT